MTKTAEEMKAITRLARGPHGADALTSQMMRDIMDTAEDGGGRCSFRFTLFWDPVFPDRHAASENCLLEALDNMRRLGYDVSSRVEEYPDGKKFYWATLDWMK